jgi:hypothetical protein
MQNSDKVLRERRLTDLFLKNRQFRYDELDRIAHDPPDWWVVRDGVKVLAIEITEYHPTEEFPVGRVGVEIRWYRDLWPKIDELRRKVPELQPIWAMVVFHEPELPKYDHHEALAAEMVRFAKMIAPKLRHDGSEISVSFLDHVPPGLDDPITSGWIHYSEAEWPVMARHVAKITLNRFNCFQAPWPSWLSPQIQTSRSSPSGKDFCRLLTKKNDKLRKAVKIGAFDPRGTPMWLLIACEVVHDLSSHAFPSEEGEKERLQEVIHKAGYDFRVSAFDEVWLMSEFSGGESLRLYPS